MIDVFQCHLIYGRRINGTLLCKWVIFFHIIRRSLRSVKAKKWRAVPVNRVSNLNVLSLCGILHLSQYRHRSRFLNLGVIFIEEKLVRYRRERYLISKLLFFWYEINIMVWFNQFFDRIVLLQLLVEIDLSEGI